MGVGNCRLLSGGQLRPLTYIQALYSIVLVTYS